MQMDGQIVMAVVIGTQVILQNIPKTAS